MKTLRNAVRVVFLALVMLTYAKDSYAGPNWNHYCNIGCAGNVRTMSCTFIDYSDYPYGIDDESSCGNDSWGDEYTQAYAHYWWMCRELAGGPPPEYATYYMSCAEQPTQGSFYCAYPDPTCGS